MLSRPTVLVASLCLAAPMSIPPAQAEPPKRTPVRGWTVGLGQPALAARGQRVADTARFEMVAVTWKTPTAPEVEVRTHTRGSWTDWRDLHVPEDHAPDRNTAEAAHASPRGTDLLWVGPSDGVQVRVDGARRKGLEVVLVDPGNRPSDAQADMSLTSARAAAGGVPAPFIRRRWRWGANEGWRDGGPWYSDTIKQAHVHHTAGSNGYAWGDVQGIIRGMYWYHTHELGWSDIGYNFLVDRFGRLWEGRAGGLRKPVRGAHTLGFNRKSFGVAAIGSYGNRRPNYKVVRSLVWLISWKMDRHNREPAGKIGLYSTGSDRYPRGTYVRLHKVDGHRDTNYTACPGDRLYAKLPRIRARAQARVDRY